MKWIGVCLMCGLLLVAIRLVDMPAVSAAGGCVPGSYLVAEASGTQSIWTFSDDGTFHVTSSAERAFGFSHIQGTWRRDGAHDTRAVGFDFGFLPEPVGAGVPPQWITRIDVSLGFSKDCRQFDGGFQLRFYDAGQDPLDPTIVDATGSDTVTGRRIEAP